MNFGEKMKEMISQGIEKSGDFLKKAGAQAQTWGEMGVLKIEIINLRGDAERYFAKLGAEAYSELVDKGNTSVSKDDPEVAALLAKLKEIDEAVDIREKKYKELGGKDSELKADKPAE